ncbi:Rab-like protein 2A [Folsomia candida]|uniref:Rab-like protein 2A n=1 Tax=Folsomia candida TaxID=158441 RepID=A0A226E5C4_FOLCA|nr:Rab-like protein 2A [Folsomia candida]
MSEETSDSSSNLNNSFDDSADNSDLTVKVICLGDSAVGKSKLLERFLSDKYKPQQVSTYALTLYRYRSKVEGEVINVDFWDTAGQERFQSLHPSYYHQADACVIVFDATRKVTYKNLSQWFDELRQYRPEIPCFCAANKIDSNMDITNRTFAFPESKGIPLYYVSAATGSNVVKLFRDAIEGAVKYKKNPTHWTDQIFRELDKTSIDEKDGEDDESPKNSLSCDVRSRSPVVGLDRGGRVLCLRVSERRRIKGLRPPHSASTLLEDLDRTTPSLDLLPAPGLLTWTSALGISPCLLFPDLLAFVDWTLLLP